MKRSFVFAFAGWVSLACAQAQTQTQVSATPPVYPAVRPVPTPVPLYVYDQKPVAGRPYLVAPEQAQSIINRFKEEYKKLGSPRVVIYVNRELVDETAGLKLSSHKQVVETTRVLGDTNTPATLSPRLTERASSTNIYRVRERKETPLADRQTVRDVERLFARPLRMAGVHVADQRIATQLIGGKVGDGFSVEPDSDQSRREREAVAKIADVVLEVLVSSKDVPVAELSGDRTYSAPDIQVTAIRLADSKILGQATAADLIGQGASAGRSMRTFGVREIAEATALSLMEDMMLQ